MRGSSSSVSESSGGWWGEFRGVVTRMALDMAMDSMVKVTVM